ncbi:hypothetical protein [Brevibacillus agri]|nr:hypothetical protein [Brevibacillus agri]MED4572879.1 hypothetical protein [Brevibacillus agri]WHX33274.1 hypothetical protein QNK09_14100 [Brevibacillus agri]
MDARIEKQQADIRAAQAPPVGKEAKLSQQAPPTRTDDYAKRGRSGV